MNPGTLKIQYCCKVLQISYTKCSIEQIVHSCAHLDYIFLFLQIKKYAWNAICLTQQQKPKPLFWWVCASLWVVASVYLLITMSLHTNSESIFFPCLLYDVFACLEGFTFSHLLPVMNTGNQIALLLLLLFGILLFFTCASKVLICQQQGLTVNCEVRCLC